MKTIDLHVHSTASDGTMTPSELAGYGKTKGLSAFALTDHNSIEGNEEAWAASERLGLGFLPGMELSSSYKGHKLHIVCLGFDQTHPDIIKLYHAIRAIKENGIPEIINFVRKKGLDIDMDMVQSQNKGKHVDIYAVMRCIASFHMYETLRPIWDEYLNPAIKELGIAETIEVEDSIPLVHSAHGITSLAHFHKGIGLMDCSREEQEQLITELHELGVDGMEWDYPDYTPEDRAFARQMIEKHKLLPTAGTDFHGSNRPKFDMGSGMQGNIQIPYEFFEKISSRVACCLMPK